MYLYESSYECVDFPQYCTFFYIQWTRSCVFWCPIGPVECRCWVSFEINRPGTPLATRFHFVVWRRIARSYLSGSYNERNWKHTKNHHGSIDIYVGTIIYKKLATKRIWVILFLTDSIFPRLKWKITFSISPTTFSQLKFQNLKYCIFILLLNI